ncbi:MAG: nitrile hydratase accessory protein [Alphaproteobacteria bacterium]|jgi:nitrile hydratase accessory protein|nr:nitrile hydratase accessory protein [Alphaproteobacteria bacterium]MDP6815378.1 nitrile hydratase accessory protein [Alphaproteobacteria bacterium]
MTAGDGRNLDALPALPRDAEGPVFNAPWEAQAFAMTVRLHEAGRFTWPEWVEVFSAEIAAAKDRGDPDLGDTYYQHWLAALEKIVAQKGLMTDAERLNRKDAWAEAAARSPHGEPILLAEDE